MNKFFLALIALTSLCVSLVSCGKEDTPQDGTTDGTYTIFYTAMVPQGMMQIGTVDFDAVNLETGKTQGFTMPDKYGNDFENSSFSITNNYLSKYSFLQDPSKYYVRYIVCKGKKGQTYSMTASFKIHDKTKLASLDNQEQVLFLGTIVLYPMAMTPENNITIFDMGGTTSSQTMTLGTLVENYDRFKDRWTKPVSKSGIIGE